MDLNALKEDLILMSPNPTFIMDRFENDILKKIVDHFPILQDYGV